MMPTLDEARALAKLWARGDEPFDLGAAGTHDAPMYARFRERQWIVPTGNGDYEYVFAEGGFRALQEFFASH